LAGLTLLAFASGCATVNAKKAGSPAEWRAVMQAPLSEEQTQQIAQGLDLAEAVRIGCERNTGAQAARKRWLAAIHVEPQATAPPDPMLEFGYQITDVAPSMNVERWNLGLTQQIPWFQKLWARGRAAATQADIAELQYEAAVRDLIVDIKDAYYELFYLDQALPITEKIEAMLRNDAILAYSGLTVGQTQLNEAFRAESQAAQLGYDRILLAEQRSAQGERLKSLLNLPPDTEIGPVRRAPSYEVASSLMDLYARAERYAEILKIRGLETQRAAYDTFLAKLTWVPDLSGGVNFMQMGPAPMISNSASTTTTGSAAPTMPAKVMDSGKDPFIGLFSMNLPIWVWRNQAEVREKKAMEEAMRLDALDTANQVRAAVAQTYFQVHLTDRLVRLYADTLLPQAEQVMGQAEILFRNDQASFTDLIETTLAYHNFTLAHLRAVADHGQAIGRLEKVLGTTAEPRTDEPEEVKGDNGLQPIVSGSSKEEEKPQP
jgi:outer membrane protein TolC